MEHRDDTLAKFRCAMYRQDPITRRVFVSLSPDSTCKTDLVNATVGFESMVLSPTYLGTSLVQAERDVCKWPYWMQGEWHETSVRGSEMIFRDATNPTRTSYRTTCLLRQQVADGEEKIQTYVQTQW